MVAQRGTVFASLVSGLLCWAAVAGPARADVPAAQADPNQLLLPLLHGLRFVSMVGAVDKAGFARTGITVDGPYLLYRPGIYQQLQAFLGKPLRQGDLQRITTTVANWYKTNNRPFVDVAFPEQNISKGVVQVVVTEFRLGEVRVRGNDWFSSGVLSSGVSLQTGDPIDARILNNDLDALNQNDFRDVSIVAERTDTPGATDLVLQTNDRFPFRFAAGYANNGPPVTGRDRWSLGVTWGNAFWLDQQLSYQFMSSDDFWLHPGNLAVRKGGTDFQAHAASYTIPLPWRDRIVISGSYSLVRPEIDPNFGEAGKTWQGSFRYVVPFTPRGFPAQELQFGFDFKRTNNDLQFGGVEISNVTTDIDEFTVNYATVLSDSWGQTKLNDRLELSPGKLTPGNTDALFQPSATHNGTPFAKASYIYNDATVYRLTPLPFSFGWIMRAEAQVSSADLLPSEKLQAGGIETVRGYDEYVAAGSQGALVTEELRTPPVGPLHELISKSINDQLQFDGFWDFGYLRDLKTVPGDNRDTMIQSAGGGLQYAMDRYLAVHLEYGHQLDTAPGAKNHRSELEASVTIGN